jgi:hypothetical protein
LAHGPPRCSSVHGAGIKKRRPQGLGH